MGIEIFPTIANNCCWPKDWIHPVMISIHKKGSQEKCDNYLLIALLFQASKILFTIINENLKSYFLRQISADQIRFVKGIDLECDTNYRKVYQQINLYVIY